ncbi:hypothetical protein [Halotia branconii]|uniref:Uncharacterized protein n=1 Tax=Halotia branconii CENA392 TaxID=1539056 RepID=A0AAJ6NNH8_9CYAN|nr:hypothetical protein [Halotia branconii]WGV23493.1 hypothetical protein QI031_16860 [Halotia branconii CENA392]
MIKAQLQSAIRQFQSWFFQAKNTNPDNVLNQPPKEIIAEFAQKLYQLPQPLKYRTTVQEALNVAIADWQQNPQAANSLVILGSPVEAIAQIVQSSLTADLLGNLQVINPLTQWQRSTDPSALQTVISNALASQLKSPQSVNSQLSERQTLIVIPCLAQCFLRCIQGWEGIEFLQNAVIQDQSRFWLIGCNYWAWTFLNQVCQVSAYLEQVQPLPELAGDELQEWLKPVTTEFKPQEGVELAYWKSLANFASGLSSVAANLWLQALRIRAADTPDAVSEAKPGLIDHDVNLEVTANLLQTNPILPIMPDLITFDRYLLHSLLLHGQMTRPHLALSLGENEQIVRSRVQTLQRAGVIVQQQEQLSLNPAYYPTLKIELSNNNFSVGDK